jgi:ATP-dependent protease HslVU (ClpYQ) peptidase subunit
VTCIVGIADGDSVYMGGDRGASDDSSIISLSQSKVIVNGEWIYGYSGSLGNGQLLDFITFPALKKADDPYKILRFEIVPLIKDLYESHGSDKDDNATDYLIGVRGRLFELSSEDWGVAEVEEVAIGSGGNFALGSLYTSKDTIDNPIIRITYALNAAITYSPTCQLPIDIKYI